jgi:hypothetical protein
MFSSRLTAKGLLLLALLVAALAVPLAYAGVARSTGPASQSCQAGNAPLPGGASTNARSGAGLTARGWDAQSAGGVWSCKS